MVGRRPASTPRRGAVPQPERVPHRGGQHHDRERGERRSGRGPADGAPRGVHERHDRRARAPRDDRRTGEARPESGRRVLPAADGRRLPDSGARGDTPDESAVLPEPDGLELLREPDRGPVRGRRSDEGEGDRRRRRRHRATGGRQLGIHDRRGCGSRAVAADEQGGRSARAQRTRVQHHSVAHPMGARRTRIDSLRGAHRMGHLALPPARRQASGHRALEHRRTRRRTLAFGALPSPDQRQLFLPVAEAAIGRSREHPRGV